MPQIEFEAAHNYEDALARAAAEAGVDREYWDIFHKRHVISADVLKQLLAAMGWKTENFEAIEADRRNRFEEKLSAALPKTVVISAAEPIVAFTAPAAAEGP